MYKCSVCYIKHLHSLNEYLLLICVWNTIYQHLDKGISNNLGYVVIQLVSPLVKHKVTVACWDDK